MSNLWPCWICCITWLTWFRLRGWNVRGNQYRCVSFAQDLIYDVTRCKVLNPERVDLYVLLSNLTGSVELEKCHQTLCRVGNSSNIPNGILLDVKHSYVLSTLFRQLVILMRYDSFCFDYQKTPSALVTTYKRRKEHISRQQFGNAPVSRYISWITRMGEKYVVC